MARHIRRSATVACLLIPLSGCVAAAGPAILAATPVIGLASMAFGGLKLYQMSTGGELRVGFDDELLDQDGIERIRAGRSLAFWPAEDRVVVALANEAETGLNLDAVITPARAGELLAARGPVASVAGMTGRERVDAFRRLAAASGADLVLGLSDEGVETNANTFSLRRATRTSRHGLWLYERSSDRIVWTATVRAELGTAALRSENIAEAETLTGRGIAERLGEIRTGVASSGQNARRSS